MVADLSVIMSDSPDPVLAGQALTYTVFVTNNGPLIDLCLRAPLHLISDHFDDVICSWHIAVKKPEPESGMKSWWESSFPCWRASGK